MPNPSQDLLDLRLGKAWSVHENDGSIYLLELVPIKPKGWIIRRAGKIFCSGMILSHRTATGYINHIKSIAEAKSEGHYEAFLELKHMAQIMPQDPPSDCNLKSLEWLVTEEPEGAVELQRPLPMRRTPLALPFSILPHVDSSMGPKAPHRPPERDHSPYELPPVAQEIENAQV